MTGLCPTCNSLVSYTRKGERVYTETKNYPFIHMSHEYEVRRVMCPVCQMSFEVERTLMKAFKDGKEVPLDTPI